MNNEDNKNYMLTFDNQSDDTNYLVTNGFNVYKEEGYCSGIDCNSLTDQGGCINQYGCYWQDDICIDYPCLDYNQEEQCDVLSSCFWDNGIRNGQWFESQDSLYIDIDSFSSFYGFQQDQELSLFGSLGDDNECFRFDFDFFNNENDTLIYNINFG